MKLFDDLKSEVRVPEGKSLTTYTLLGIFLGAYGVHNFWAGNTEKAKAQLLTTIVGGCCCCIGPMITFVTVIMDIVKARQADSTAQTVKTEPSA